MARFKLEVVKPEFSFEGKDLTYPGETINANDYITNIPEGTKLSWNVKNWRKSGDTLRVDSESGIMEAGTENGTATITCSIYAHGRYTEYNAKIKVKIPKAKESIKIKDGKKKKLSLSNVSTYTDVQWSSSSPAVSIERTKKPYSVKLTVNTALDPESKITPPVVTAVIDGQEYKTTIQIK